MAVEGISARPFLDHNVDVQLAIDLRHHGFDVTYASELGTERQSDEFHLQWATEHGRVVFTHDLKDFQAIATRWFYQGREHAGIILSEAPPELPYGEMLRRLLGLLDQLSADQLMNQLLWLNEAWRT